MTESFSFPSECLVRPAFAQDRWAIEKLLFSFRQEVSTPKPTPTSLQKFIYYGLMLSVLVVAGVRIWQIEWSILWNVLLYPLGLFIVGLTAALGLTWLSNLLTRDWSNYWVIECEGKVVACVKLYCYQHYSMLYSLFVALPWRHRGLGSYLVRSLATQVSKPLYLVCLPERVGFYTRLGFQVVTDLDEVPFVKRHLDLSNPQSMLLMLT
jgi:N-acetylglutamate synthase-like GNAT family acetyltransferase